MNNQIKEYLNFIKIMDDYKLDNSIQVAEPTQMLVGQFPIIGCRYANIVLNHALPMYLESAMCGRISYELMKYYDHFYLSCNKRQYDIEKAILSSTSMYGHILIDRLLEIGADLRYYMSAKFTVSSVWLSYAKQNMCIDPEIKEMLKKSISGILWYSRYVLNARWEEAESFLLANAGLVALVSYCKNVFGGRWDGVEIRILNSLRDGDYSKSSIRYARDVIHGRWLEFEEILHSSCLSIGTSHISSLKSEYFKKIICVFCDEASKVEYVLTYSN